jgi:hypothetical protein
MGSDRDKTPPLTPGARARTQADQSRPANILIPEHEEGDTERRDRRAVSHWGDDERIAAGADARRRVRTPVLGVPFGIADADNTTPIEMFLAEPNDEDREAVRRSRRDSNASVKQEELAAAVRLFKDKLRRLAEREKSNNEERADQLLELLNRPPDEATKKLGDRVTALEGIVKLLRVVLFLVVGGSGGYGLVIAQKIWDRAEAEGEAAIRLQHVEDAVKQLGQDIRSDLAHRYSPALPSWLQPPPQKDHTP